MTLLRSGQVLIAGGESCVGAGGGGSISVSGPFRPSAAQSSLLASSSFPSVGLTCTTLNTAQVYDPVSGGIRNVAGPMIFARTFAAATVLTDGRVLIAGGFDDSGLPAPAEIYDPASDSFNGVGVLNAPRFAARATLLNNGQVLISGGSTCNTGCPTRLTELYNPATSTFTYTPASALAARLEHTATLLTNGQVLLAGGFNSCTASACVSDGSTELYDPAAGTFSASSGLQFERAAHTAILLNNGNVFLAGGFNGGITVGTSESYHPASLTPPGLISISITPSNPSVLNGTSQSLTAVGAFSDGSTQTLQSVLWRSSNVGVASVSNASGSSGFVSALSIGTSTISASAGSVTGSTVLTVPSLVSLAVAPSHPSVSVGTHLQLTVTSTFSDGSTHDVTSVVAWISSDRSIALVSAGLTFGIGAGTATISATQGNVLANALLTVSPAPPPPIVPVIAGASTTSGAPGTQVTITGSGFGSPQGNGIVWLGSLPGVVVSWTDQMVVANVATGAASGLVQIEQSGQWSNSLAFAVSAPTILTVAPPSGLPGTLVTITGSGFGTPQGNGSVWLGTAQGIVVSWTDGQVTANVAPGSSSGVAQIIQNGVLSNSVAFTTNTPHITKVSPSAGAPGTIITIIGSGFGSPQGGGTIQLGNTAAIVSSWTDSQVVALVAASAQNGFAQIVQNGVPSNVINFSVPPSGTRTTVSITPSLMNLLVGSTRSLQALDVNGIPIHGLTWAVTDSTVTSLSTDDPPILTALAPGHVTITAGDGSADITVYSEAGLTPGTVIWSNPGDGSGVTKIVPAVPSATGVADVFSFQASGNVQAIASDGTVAWTANIGQASAMPDFQGGLVVMDDYSIKKLDGLTGQSYPAYTYAQPPCFPNQHQGCSDYSAAVLAHTDGTIFALEADSVIGIDPTTGQSKFRVPMEHGNTDVYGRILGDVNPSVRSMIVAGDGYAYASYLYRRATQTTTNSSSSRYDDVYLKVLRVGPGGDSSSILVKHWSGENLSAYMTTGYINAGEGFCDSVCQSYGGGIACESNYTCANGHHVDVCLMAQCAEGVSTSDFIGVPDLAILAANLITNADQGVTLSLMATEGAQGHSVAVLNFCDPCTPAQSTSTPSTNNSYLASISSSGGMTLTQLNSPDLGNEFRPVLQAQDGSYIGTIGNLMAGLTTSGTLKWTVPGFYSPVMATADGGVVAKSFDGLSTLIFDQNGNANGQLSALPTLSWKGAYQLGSTEQISDIYRGLANTWASVFGGNLTHANTYIKHPTINLVWCGLDLSCQFQDFGTPAGMLRKTLVGATGSVDLGLIYKQVPPLLDGTCSAPCFDFTAIRQDWVNTIRAKAFAALKGSFSQFPILVSDSNTVDPSKLMPKASNIVYVVGYFDPSVTNTSAGATSISSDVDAESKSFVLYQNVMEAGELNLWYDHVPRLPVLAFPLQSPSEVAQFDGLIQALGIAIGNIAAHELGHQFKVNKIGCDGSGNLPCPVPAQQKPFLWEYYSVSVPQYQYIGAPLTWLPENIQYLNGHIEGVKIGP